jgi:hypothetical protein
LAGAEGALGAARADRQAGRIGIGIDEDSGIVIEDSQFGN